MIIPLMTESLFSSRDPYRAENHGKNADQHENAGHTHRPVGERNHKAPQKKNRDGKRRNDDTEYLQFPHCQPSIKCLLLNRRGLYSLINQGGCSFPVAANERLARYDKRGSTLKIC
jgi:hypothetical protein